MSTSFPHKFTFFSFPRSLFMNSSMEPLSMEVDGIVTHWTFLSQLLLITYISPATEPN